MRISSAQKYTFIFIGIGLILAAGIYYMMVGNHMFLMLSGRSFLIGLICAFFGFCVCGIYVSIHMNHLINVKRINPEITGIVGSIIILTIGVIVGCAAFIWSSNNYISSLSHLLTDYFYVPLILTYWVGGLPTIILGAILGRMIKN